MAFQYQANGIREILGDLTLQKDPYNAYHYELRDLSEQSADNARSALQALKSLGFSGTINKTIDPFGNYTLSVTKATEIAEFAAKRGVELERPDNSYQSFIGDQVLVNRSDARGLASATRSARFHIKKANPELAETFGEVSSRLRKVSQGYSSVTVSANEVSNLVVHTQAFLQEARPHNQKDIEARLNEIGAYIMQPQASIALA